jgi:hypothetical protein
MRITRITAPDGSVTTIKSKSTCGCVTALAFVVVLFGPAAWFPPTLAILAYVLLGVIVVLAGAGWLVQKAGRTQRAPQPPPVAAPPAPAPPAP